MLLGLINPLAALIPLIETGPGKDVKAPCADLVGSLQAKSRRAGEEGEQGTAAPARVSASA